jgi:ribulose-bisphosphate carboxylase large chain
VSRFRISYLLACGEGEDPAAKARAIALEQTVELPVACVSAEVRRAVVGSTEAVEPVAGGRYRAVIAYPEATVGSDLLPYVNLLFGNASLKAGIRIADVEVPPGVREQAGGPRFGIAGLRALCGVEGRPLLCAAVKPVGLSARQLAEVCHAFAAGGIDIVKDDHGLADQRSAPFAERVARCQEAVARANAETGARALYAPHLFGGGSALRQQAELARQVGCVAGLVCPLLVGLDAVRELAAQSGLALLAHPALAGAYFQPDHGIAPEVLLGKLFRLAGADGVIYPNVGGRFTFTRAVCDAINVELRRPAEGLRPAFPVPAGGIDAARVPYWIEQYGPDTIFLLGASLYAQRDLRGAAARLAGAVAGAGVGR